MFAMVTPPFLNAFLCVLFCPPMGELFALGGCTRCFLCYNLGEQGDEPMKIIDIHTHIYPDISITAACFVASSHITYVLEPNKPCVNRLNFIIKTP